MRRAPVFPVLSGRTGALSRAAKRVGEKPEIPLDAFRNCAILNRISISQPGGRLGRFMSNVIVKENESLDSALRRFKRNGAKAGIQQEIRKREHYEKPSVRRKKKSEAARKRKFN